jgi:hypothetical protein
MADPSRFPTPRPPLLLTGDSPRPLAVAARWLVATLPGKALLLGV